MVLDNTVFLTLPILLLSFETAARYGVKYLPEQRGVNIKRWLRISLVVLALFVPSLAAIATACAGLAAAVLMLLVAKSYKSVSSKQLAGLQRSALAVGLALLSAVPLVVTARLLE